MPVSGQRSREAKLDGRADGIAAGQAEQAAEVAILRVHGDPLWTN